MTDADLIARAAALPFFREPSRVEVLHGGKTNHNVMVEDARGRFVVRFGQDIPEHGILRWHERAVAQAAARAGIAPPVVHVAEGVMVLDWVDAVPLTPAHRAAPGMVERLAALVARVHREVAVEGPALAFHLPQVLAGYAALLRARGSPHLPQLAGLMADGERLIAAIGPGETRLCHNDLLPGNILVGGGRIWLIDWEYAGYGNPLFDLGGLASNNGFSPAEERLLLEAHADAAVTDALWRRYGAMKAASLLREVLWSMVSEMTSALPVDYAAYTAENLAAFRAALADFEGM